MNSFLGILATPIGYLLKAVYGVIGNYGISIIVLTILVRALMLPLYGRQFKYQAAMAEIGPKVQEIQTRYAADREKMSEEMNKLYAEANVKPMAGCLPLLIQFPIIIGLYSLLRDPLLYMSNSQEMAIAVHESFMWMNDLCQPDSWILPILAGVTTYFTYTVSAGDTPGGNDATAGMMKSMQWIFPVMIFVMGKTFPAGLAIYWAVGNVFSIVQGLVMKKIKRKQNLKASVKEDLRKERKARRNRGY